jgi:hypothetical protein
MTQQDGGKVIKIQPRNSYGNTLYYPMCDNGRAFARLTNTKTLTKEHLRDIRALGFTHEVVPITVNLEV